jgi:ferredoxin/flavodoxin
MINRRKFISCCAAAAAGCSIIPANANAGTIAPVNTLRKAAPEKAVVIYYSQTGHTRIYSELIAETWEKAGLKVDTVFIKKADISSLPGYDLIGVGSPVHYLDAPVNVKNWLGSIPSIKGSGTVSFASYGGNGDGQRRAAASILKMLSDKGGVPLGMDMFGNMSTYPPTWSLGNSERILKFRDRPNEKTYEGVRAFASKTLVQYGRGGISFATEPGSILSGKAMMAPTKLFISHKLIKSKCIACGKCMRQCPTGAIDIAEAKIDEGKCILCFGCLNNCPADAHEMKIFGKKLYGFPDFLKRNNIKIALP